MRSRMEVRQGYRLRLSHTDFTRWRKTEQEQARAFRIRLGPRVWAMLGRECKRRGYTAKNMYEARENSEFPDYPAKERSCNEDR